LNVTKGGLTAKDFLGDTVLVMLCNSRTRRRGFGMACLMGAGLMLIFGQTVLRPHLEGWGFILYWMGCFLLTGWAVIAALLDLRAVTKETRHEQSDILHELVEEIKKETATQESLEQGRTDDQSRNQLG
jgi:hypothetical protein